MKTAVILLFSILVLNASGNNNPVLIKTTFQGVITEAGTSETLTGARVSIKGTEIFAYSNKDGEFEFTEIPSGPFELEIQLVSFENKVVNIDASCGITNRLDITLDPR